MTDYEQLINKWIADDLKYKKGDWRIGKKLLPEQKETLGRYYRNCRRNKKQSLRTIYNAVNVLHRLSLSIQKPYKEMTADELEDYLLSREISDSALNTEKMIVQTFFKYVYGTDYKPEPVKWIKCRTESRKYTPDDVLTIEEINSMISKCKSTRDKTLVAMFYDTGGRIGELIENSNYGDLKQDNRGMYIRVRGKTGERPIRLKDSVVYLNDYLNVHPSKNPSDPLFVSYDVKRLSTRQAYRIIKNAARDAKIEKNVFPHLFRHTKITHMATLVSDQILKKQFGWKPSSRMTENYVHVSEEMQDRAICEAYGIKIPEEEDVKNELKTIKCNNCQTLNPYSYAKCSNCKLFLHSIDEHQLVETSEEVTRKAVIQVLDDFGISAAELKILAHQRAKQKKLKAQQEDEDEFFKYGAGNIEDYKWMEEIDNENEKF